MPDAQPDDFLCERCGYNLLGIDPRSACPECGIGVGDSCVRAGLDPQTLLPSGRAVRWWHLLTRPRWFFQNAEISAGLAWEFFGYHTLATLGISVIGGACTVMLAAVAEDTAHAKTIDPGSMLYLGLLGGAGAGIAFVISLLVGAFCLLVLWAAASVVSRWHSPRAAPERTLPLVLLGTVSWPLMAIVTVAIALLRALVGSDDPMSAAPPSEIRSALQATLAMVPIMTLAAWVVMIVIGLRNTRFANSRRAILAYLDRSTEATPREVRSAPPPAAQTTPPA